jgi:hypothetical protein
MFSEAVNLSVRTKRVLQAYPTLFCIEHFSHWLRLAADRFCFSDVPRNFFRGGSKIQLSAEGRENGDLGAEPSSQGFRSIYKWVKPVFLLGCYGCIFHGPGNSARLFQNFGISEGLNPRNPSPSSVRHCSVFIPRYSIITISRSFVWIYI